VSLRIQGRNRLHLSSLDKDHYCVLVQLAQQRSDSEVMDMMHAPETMQEALQRIQVRPHLSQVAASLKTMPHKFKFQPSCCPSACRVSKLSPCAWRLPCGINVNMNASAVGAHRSSIVTKAELNLLMLQGSSGKGGLAIVKRSL